MEAHYINARRERVAIYEWPNGFPIEHQLGIHSQTDRLILDPGTRLWLRDQLDRLDEIDPIDEVEAPT